MSKKGATNSGGTAGRQRTQDSAMASRLAPAPKSWNTRADRYPYHANMRKMPKGFVSDKPL
jgi:hypothetical protein